MDRYVEGFQGKRGPINEGNLEARQTGEPELTLRQFQLGKETWKWRYQTHRPP